jgi:hypothetical protein
MPLHQSFAKAKPFLKKQAAFVKVWLLVREER